jgi:hypothetical protein
MTTHECFQTLAGAPPVLDIKKMPTDPFLAAVTRFVLVPSTAKQKSSFIAPFPKSKTLLKFLVMDELMKNQPQTDTLLGNVMEGSWKNCELVPVKNALFELAPNGPDAWAVGEDAEAVRAPVTPLLSRRSSPGLKV